MDPITHVVRPSAISQRLTLIFFVSATMFSNGAFGQNKTQLVRIANLQIDSAQIDSYRAALREEIETSIRVEPGVLTLYAVEEKNRLGHVTIFEVYANEGAYKTHLETAHFKKYKNDTKTMVKSLQLVETNPIVLGAKPAK